MSYNRFAKTVRKLQPGERVPLLNAKIEEVLCPVGFEPYLIDNQICVGFTENPISESVGQEEAYYFDGGLLTVPRKMYRLKSLTEGIEGDELAPCILSGGHSASFTFVTNARIEDTRNQCAGNMTLNHHCHSKVPVSLSGKGKTGGGVCGKKLTSNFSYTAELWKWSEVYTADGRDPYGIDEAIKERIIYHYLMQRFNLEEAVILVSLLLTDNSIVRIPVDPEKAEDVHNQLSDPNQNDAIYGIDDLVLLDGPDILLGTCNFEPLKS